MPLHERKIAARVKQGKSSSIQPVAEKAITIQSSSAVEISQTTIGQQNSKILRSCGAVRPVLGHPLCLVPARKRSLPSCPASFVVALFIVFYCGIDACADEV
mmetsp:Transcript_65170/g.76563  ORF Transcript_65170/g.76563 Transcript_65170/m.76563 type:complete len:102 (+) Transcript_65170:1810-2115(+)